MEFRIFLVIFVLRCWNKTDTALIPAGNRCRNWSPKVKQTPGYSFSAACVRRVTGDSGGLSPVLRCVCAGANTPHPLYPALNYFFWLCHSRCEWVISRHIEKAKSMHPLAFCSIAFVYGVRLVHQRSFNTAGASRLSALTGTPNWFL